MKNKVISIILGVALMGSIGFNIHYMKDKFLIGDNIERERLLECTMWKLSQEGYKKSDIESIKVWKSTKGGNLPYSVRVVLKKDKSRVVIYNWIDNNKQDIGVESYRANLK